MSYSPSTTAHAVLADVGLRLPPADTISSVQYDDSSSLLLVLTTTNTLHAYATHPPPTTPPTPPALKFSLPLPEGPPPGTIRVSPDHTLLAIQRRPTLIEFISLTSANTFVHGPHRALHPLLTFFLTDCPDAPLVLLTTHALEACTYAPARHGFRLAHRTPLPTPLRWWRYSHDTRVAAVGTLPTGSHILAFQFTPTGLLRLPPLDLRPPGPARAPSPISDSEVALLKLYSRVYLAYLDRDAMRLELHRYYTDAALLEATYDIFSPHLSLLTADNLLIAHHPDSAVAVLLDVLADPANAIANPLPLRLLPPPSSTSSTTTTTTASTSASTSAAVTPTPAVPSTSAAAHHHRPASPPPALVPPNPGTPYPPNIILDPRTHTLYRAHLDLQAIARSTSDPALLTAVLQRRRPSTQPPNQPSPHALLLSTVKAALQERVPTTTLRRIFDHLTLAAAATAATDGTPSRSSAPPLPHPPPTAILTPDDISRHIFRWAHDEEVVDAPYLAAALTEYQLSAQEAGLQLPPYMQLLAMEMLLQQGQSFQVGQALAIHPPLGSLFFAEHLEDCAAAAGAGVGGLAGAGGSEAALGAIGVTGPRGRPKGVEGSSSSSGGGGGSTVSNGGLMGCGVGGAGAGGSSVGQLAQDIHARAALLLRGGAAGDRYCRRLLSEGRLLRAARVMRNWGLAGVPPQYFLEASGKRGDQGLMAAAYRQWAPALAESCPRFEQARQQYLVALEGQEGGPQAGGQGGVAGGGGGAPQEAWNGRSTAGASA